MLMSLFDIRNISLHPQQLVIQVLQVINIWTGPGKKGDRDSRDRGYQRERRCSQSLALKRNGSIHSLLSVNSTIHHTVTYSMECTTGTVQRTVQNSLWTVDHARARLLLMLFPDVRRICAHTYTRTIETRERQECYSSSREYSYAPIKSTPAMTSQSRLPKKVSPSYEELESLSIYTLTLPLGTGALLRGMSRSPAGMLFC